MKIKHKKYYGFALPALVLCLAASCAGRPVPQSINTDSLRFASEYSLVGNDNIFTYRTAAETADILANGTGVVFIGFRECPWCQQYAVFLNDTAKASGMEKIFYCDILEDRQNNSAVYQKITGILDGKLQYDDEGRPRVYVPDVTVIDSGKIIGRDYETSKDTLGYEDPKDYWTDERIDALKKRLAESMSRINKICGACDY